ncbi:glycine--tRNA ligase subunit beta [Athalassotoga saccharophila]|uniref:glycine--tRNA ligase subunit beta n=1 Tax=Athalassotoga saccharophila TaxID=1441386 RepID=UPI00137B4FF1|nr:glycine--tRNA ligase subunit beta [Athalassotoga saccharophila]BBJ27463.1 glycine--tRNA ligase beta subunit [Athalassotoga saccharophila]
MSEYLLEILLEEMPVSDMENISSNFEKNIDESLQKLRIDHGKIEIFLTPRRFGFLIHDLSESQKDTVILKKGPSEKIAFENGKPSRALEGFLKSNNADLSEIEISEENGGRYVFLRRTEKGKLTKELIPHLMPDLLKNFQFSRPMRWANGDFSYTRPVHSIISMIDGEVIPFEFMGKHASNKTRTHRYLNNEITIDAAQNYEEVMRNGMVILKVEEREKMVRDGIKNSGLDVIKDDDLVHEISFIAEYPQPVIGKFKEEFLILPDPVLKTVLRHHQRTFITRRGNKVSNEFLAFQDGPASREKNVRSGYEKVINARLEDAKFYQMEDLKFPLEYFNSKLQEMTFQKNLGTIMDKVLRVKSLSVEIAKMIGLDGEIKLVERAAILSKSDLGTNMVYEFPELQGIMGSIYARDEDPRVALAIKEQYDPDGLEGDLPSDTIGGIIGIADRMDTICANFSIGEIPSGSKDPYALRKKVFAVLRILIGFEWDVDLKSIISISEKLLGRKVPYDSIESFFKGRLDLLLRENGISQDVSKAVMSLWNKPFRSMLSAKAIEKSRSTEGFEDFIIAYTRVHNISKNHNSFEYHVELFDEEEKKLFSFYMQEKEKVEDALLHLNYSEAFDHLRSLKPYIDEYFENVFVMSPREDLRLNRLGFLKNLDDLFLNFGELSLLLKTVNDR